MDLRQLRYFLTVADECHFGRAAEKLHIAQPALSMQIKALEENLGGPLFTRTTRRVELTDAGRTLVPEARRILSMVSHADDVTRSSLRGDMGQIRIGFVGNAVLSGILVEDLRAFRKAHPKVEITLAEAAPKALRDGLQSSEIDVAYMSFPGSEPDLQALPVQKSTVVATMSVDHRLTAVDELTLKDLSGVDLLLYGAEMDGMLEGLGAHGYTPAMVHKLPSTLAIIAAAAAGMGVALAPEQAEQLGVPGLAFRPIPELSKEASLFMLHRKRETKGATMAYIREAQARQKAAK